MVDSLDACELEVEGGSDIARPLDIGKVIQNLPAMAVEREKATPYGPVTAKVRMSEVISDCVRCNTGFGDSGSLLEEEGNGLYAERGDTALAAIVPVGPHVLERSKRQSTAVDMCCFAGSKRVGLWY